METEALSIQNSGLALSLLLVLSCMILLWLERLKIQGEIVSGTLRSFIQLVVLGYVIEFVFELDQMIWVLAMIAVMILAGAHTAKRRARGLGRPWSVCIVSLLAGTIFSLGVLFAFGIVSLKGRYLIPLAGIVIGNAVRTLSISLDRLWGEFKNRRNEIEAALALGASAHEAAKFSRWAALRAALIPSIDGMKIIGLVQMPGAMLGMLMAGASPLEAVKLQIVVLYLILASSTFTVVLGVEMACRARFTPAQQLKPA
jgi:putative ABC transport system permease protein